MTKKNSCVSQLTGLLACALAVLVAANIGSLAPPFATPSADGPVWVELGINAEVALGDGRAIQLLGLGIR